MYRLDLPLGKGVNIMLIFLNYVFEDSNASLKSYLGGLPI